MNIRIENWNGHEIRFVEKEPGDWWAALADLTKALDISQTAPLRRRLPDDVILNHMVESGRGLRKTLIVNEYGIYQTVFESRKPEADSFKRWVFEMLKELRKASGFEGFQIFRMLDKEHQREAMEQLHRNLSQPEPVTYIKANTIANKAVSTLFGHPKMVKKDSMSPEMLAKRQEVLEDTVNLMSVVDKFGLDVSVSDAVYAKHLH